MAPIYYCIVPYCTNTKLNSNKEFFLVPKDIERRLAWLRAIGRNYSEIGLKPLVYVCEDHFNLEQDMKKYNEWRYYPRRGSKSLKRNVVPHIFDCQPAKQSESQPTSFMKEISSFLHEQEVQESINIMTMDTIAKFGELQSDEDFIFSQLIYGEMKFLSSEIKYDLKRSIQQALSKATELDADCQD